MVSRYMSLTFLVGNNELGALKVMPHWRYFVLSMDIDLHVNSLGSIFRVSLVLDLSV